MTESFLFGPPENIGLPPCISGYIELFGLCGAGKTTITDSLLPLFQVTERKVIAARPISPGGIGTSYHALRLALRAIISSPGEVSQFLFHHGGRRLFLKLGLRIASMEIRNARPRTLLVDSGVLQPLVSFVVEQNMQKLKLPLQALMMTVPFPAAAVYVRVAPDVAYCRYLSRRSRSNFKIDEQGLRCRFDDGFALCEWIRDYFNFMNIPILVIDSSDHLHLDQLSELAEQIADIL